MLNTQPVISEGSVAWKVVQFLANNPDEQLDADSIAQKYDCQRGNVHTLLAAAVKAGAIHRGNDRETGEVIYTPALKGKSIEQRCIAAYRASRNLDEACAAAGVHKLTMFKILKINGVMLAEDRLTIGSVGSRLGASAEQEFQRLVPRARSMNAIVSSNPGFDFEVGGWRVDVKAFGPIKIAGRKSNVPRWQIKLGRRGALSPHVDFFCIFLTYEPTKPLQQCVYQCYLVPAELAAGRNYLNKTEGLPSALDSLQVSPAELAAFFAEGGAA